MSQKTYLSVDGGGTKLRMLLFDDDFQILGEGLSGGVNLNSTTEPDARANIRQCLEQVFSRISPEVIDKLYYIFVGQAGFLLEALKDFCPARSLIPMSEPLGGLLAGALWRNGLVALSGTGSDVFYVPGEPKRPLENTVELRMVVGAWGPIIGDQGSGAWIGQQAIRRIVAGIEGWAEPTMMADLIRREWKLQQDWDMVRIVYGSSAPFRKVGSLTRIVEEAADAGDSAARDIVTEAGHLMAMQTLCLVNRFRIPAADYRLVCCGGAWKTHPLFFETFRKELAQTCPGLAIRLHRFEHVMAGPASKMLDNTAESRIGEAEERLAELFPDYAIRWKSEELMRS